MFGDFQVVRDNDDRTALLIELLEQRQNFLAGAGVERARRLIGEYDRRIGHNGTGDGHALPLPAGKLIGPVMAALAKADDGQCFQGLFLGIGRAAVQERQFHVFQRIHARQ